MMEDMIAQVTFLLSGQEHVVNLMGATCEQVGQHIVMYKQAAIQVPTHIAELFDKILAADAASCTNLIRG